MSNTKDTLSYLTLLPPMHEGFHTGYQTQAGIVAEQNKKPRQWLENFAKHMQAQGEAAGFSIPDVLAVEQQLRRLASLPHDVAIRHQEMIDYRALLALLLLWDSWQKDATWPTLSLEHPTDQSPFTRSVQTALSPERAKDGLWVYTLTAPEQPAHAHPLCMLSRTMVLMPAANLGDLSDLLPAHVRWYDRTHKCFLDPCDYLDECDMSRLLLQLRMLNALNESEALQSPLYSPDAQLCGLLARFCADLLHRREGWRQRFAAGDGEATLELRTRIMAVYGLRTLAGNTPRITEQIIRTEVSTLAQNPLINAFLQNGAPPESTITDVGLTLYLLDGIPFARLSSSYLLEPTYAEGENEALRLATQEIALYDQFHAQWNQDIAATLHTLKCELNQRVGINMHVPALLDVWEKQYAAYAVLSDRRLTLSYPLQKEIPAALSELLSDILGPIDRDILQAPFSDCLLLMENAQQPPFEDATLAQGCLLREGCYVLPPLSPQLLVWLQAQSEESSLSARLDLSSLCFTASPAQNQITASFCVLGRAREEGAVITDAITFTRTYTLSNSVAVGGAFSLPANELPYVAVWPNVRLSQGQWTQYYVYAHRPEAVDVWVLAKTGWSRGTSNTTTSEGICRTWQTACVDRFPTYVVLKRGELSLGALCNPCPPTTLKLETAAVVGVDFGSIATTVMLAQAQQQRPASLPSCLHHALLHLQVNDEHFLSEELLPKNALLATENGRESTFYSAMDMFSDDSAHWQNVLRDGHIYYRQALGAMLAKSENALYYDLKWGENDYTLRLLRLFLKQVLVQASLCARLLGSPSVSWRISMPTALPAHKQESYLELMRGLAREVAQETGLPLTQGCPAVLFASENQADGLYFLGRNEVAAQNGYLNMDIGGGTTDLSLWLNGATHATAECSLRLGCRQMLFDSLEEFGEMTFDQDFLHAPADTQKDVQAILHAFRQGSIGSRGRQKAMLLLDDFFAVHAQAIRQAMAQARAEGKIGHVESLLLFNIGFLFFLCGMLLQRAFEQEELCALLPARMALCIAGNGGQLLKIFSDEQREKLCRLSLSCLTHDHPLVALLPVQSLHPKQEVALGLLSDAGKLQSTLQATDRWNGTPEDRSQAMQTNYVLSYLPKFYQAFPQAADHLLPNTFETSGTHATIQLTSTASMELETIFENERFKTPTDDLTTLVRCFTGMKRLWRV